MARRVRTVLAVSTSLLAVAGVVTPADAAPDDPWAVIQVLDPDGHPVPAGIGVYPEIYADPGGGLTDARGRVVVEHDSLLYRPAGLCAALDPTTQHLAGPTGWAPVCGVVVDQPTTQHLTLRFTVGAALTGRLVDARTGLPVQGARIETPNPSDQDPDIAPTDSHGRWRQVNLPAGPVRPGLSTPGGLSPGAPWGFAYDYDIVGAASGVLKPGRTTDIGTTALTPLVKYSGTATDTDGHSASGATVLIGDVDGDPSTPYVNPDQTVHGSDGTWSISVPWSPSPHRMTCAYSSAVDTEHPAGLALTCTQSTSAKITIAQTLALADGGAIAGSVTDRSQGYFPTVPVRVHGEDVPVGGVYTTTKSFLVAGVPPGTRTVQIQVSFGGDTFSSQPVRVRPGVTTHIGPIPTS